MSEKTRLRSEPLYSSLIDAPRVDKENGVIYKVAVTTEGECKGHGTSIDSDFVDSVVTMGNSWSKGLKGRFGHPNMSSTALGTYLGRHKNFRSEIRDGKLIAFSDFYLDEVAKESPWGDFYTYVFNLAESNPDQFGTSIVFKPGAYYRLGPEGQKVYENEQGFNGLDGPVFETIEKLWACDVVDDPAANPDGLFSESTFAGLATNFLDENPKFYTLLKKNPEIVEKFLNKYNENKPAAQGSNKTEAVMDLKTFKAQHPDIFEEAFEAGVAEERKRVNAHVKLGEGCGDMSIALSAIKNGSVLDMELQAEYLTAGINRQAVQSREQDNPEVPTPEADGNKNFSSNVLAKAAEKLGVEVNNG